MYQIILDHKINGNKFITAAVGREGPVISLFEFNRIDPDGIRLFTPSKQRKITCDKDIINFIKEFGMSEGKEIIKV